jgi:hypothetical protein
MKVLVPDGIDEKGGRTGLLVEMAVDAWKVRTYEVE